MTDQTRERLRLNLLQQMHAVRPYGLSTDHLRTGAIDDFLQVTRDEVAFEARALVELELAALTDNGVVSGTEVRWKITKAGTECLVKANRIS